MDLDLYGGRNVALTILGLVNIAVRRLSKKLSYRGRTARRAMLVNSCYVSRGTGARKVSISKSDVQDHSRALAMVPFDRPHTIFYLTSMATMSLSCTGNLGNLIRALVHLCTNQHTTFALPSFTDSKSKDMTGGKIKITGHVKKWSVAHGLTTTIRPSS